MGAIFSATNAHGIFDKEHTKTTPIFLKKIIYLLRILLLNPTVLIPTRLFVRSKVKSKRTTVKILLM